MPTPDDDRGAPAHSHAALSSLPADGVIDLEPSLMPDAETWGAEDPAQGSAPGSRADSEGGLAVSSEFTALLRSRLQAAAGFVTLAYLAFLLFSLANPDSVYRMAAVSVALRMLVAAGVFGLLFSSMALTYRQLRAVEYAFFGVDMLIMLYAQYTINGRLVEQGNAASMVAMVAFEKNGVLRTFMMMMIYGVFIPNDPKVTSRVVMTMAAGPIVVLAMVLHHEFAMNTTADQMASSQNLISNALFLVIGAALAIFSAHILKGMRLQLHDARQLGQYRLLNKLGEGGMGEVYLAEHQLLKRPCAVKLINADLEDNSIALARFEREVQSAAMLSHPNTIEIYDYGRADDGTFYYVMEYLPGLSVSDLVRQGGPLPPGRAVYILRQACGSLAEAHRMGLVHRDLKPANILVAILGGECDVAKVLDFGLVKVENPTDGLNLTAEYTVSGTPSYMSPEQARGVSDIDGRADIYALGAILYFMLTGKPPFERDSPMSLMIAHAGEPVTPPTQLRPDIPADLEAVALRCLAKAPADRFADARSLAAALAACGCARDWDQAHAEQWWLDHAANQAPMEEALQMAAV